MHLAGYAYVKQMCSEIQKSDTIVFMSFLLLSTIKSS